MDKRQYVRLNSCFAIDFTIVRLQGDLLGIGWAKGCTQNVSKSGLCLETSVLSESMIKYLDKEDIYLELHIQVPFKKEPMKAIAEVVWYELAHEDDPSRYIIGMKFHSVMADELTKLIGMAERGDAVRKVVTFLAVAVLLFIIFIMIF